MRDEVEQLHTDAIELAVDGSRRSEQKYAEAPKDIVRDALFILTRDAVVVHRAILPLASRGWSAPGGALLRTHMDIHVSALAILHSADPKLAAFRYFYSGYRALSRGHPHYSAEDRRNAREEVRRRIDQLPKKQRPGALEFLKERDRPYWFSNEWPNPRQVIEQFGGPGLGRAYRQLSSVAHGGFFGMRLFADDPNYTGINAQLPTGPRAESLALTSARLVIDLTALRDAYEGLGLAARCQGLREKIVRVGRPAGSVV